VKPDEPPVQAHSGRLEVDGTLNVGLSIYLSIMSIYLSIMYVMRGGRVGKAEGKPWRKLGRTCTPPSAMVFPLAAVKAILLTASELV
jgi:hypothetical protein